MAHTITTFIVDAFTDTPFKGNPAGVCILEIALTETVMQNIAKELGLSETAFVRFNPKTSKYTIRYFSPKMEIPLCGHATLAASKVLLESSPQLETLCFNTVDALDLQVFRKGQSIEMAFPVYALQPQQAPKSLLEALGISQILYSAYNAETQILLLEIESAAVLRELTPNFEALKRSHDAINGVLVTSKSQDPEFDFESRYFWPWSGTNEDPVTGGTHTFLAPYWSKRLGKTKLESYQCSERSGFMTLDLSNAGVLKMRSAAQIVFKGELYL